MSDLARKIKVLVPQCPEGMLTHRVFDQALSEVNKTSYNKKTRQMELSTDAVNARRWLDNSRGFRFWCDMGNLDNNWVSEQSVKEYKVQ